MAQFITPIQPITFGSFGSTENSENKGDSVFQEVLGSAMENLDVASKASQEDGIGLATGDVDDLAQIQINSLKSQAMIQTTVQLTSRVVNAYKEIMQTQI